MVAIHTQTTHPQTATRTTIAGFAYQPSSWPVSTIAPSALHQYVEAPPAMVEQPAPPAPPSPPSPAPSILREETPPPPDFIASHMEKARAAAKVSSSSDKRAGRRSQRTKAVEREAQAGPSRLSPFALQSKKAAPEDMDIDDDELA